MVNSKKIILHHYASSPYAEKIRRALAMKNLAWSSVDIPTVMPKPDLVALTGGYRRTPVMQIGSDIFCDTALILRELDDAFPVTNLNLPGHEGLADMVASWTNKVWFPISIAVIFGSLANHLPEEFKADRAKLSGREFDVAQMKAAVPEAKTQWRAQLAFVEDRLVGGRASGTGAWLVGVKPGLIDIHAYMNIWFAHSTLNAFAKEAFKDAPLAEDWFGRMAALKGQEGENLSAASALTIAKTTAPRLKPANVTLNNYEGLEAGQSVEVAPTDYGIDWVQGQLVQLDLNKIVIERTNDDTGPLHIHFPRAGYRVRPIETN